MEIMMPPALPKVVENAAMVSLAVLYGSAGHEHGEGGEGADDDGIRKYLEHAEAALMHSGVVIRSGMGDRSGAKTGLVGEHAASDASLDGGGDGYAGNAADNCGGSEGAHEDAAEHVAYVAYVCKEDYQCGDYVDHRHEGDQPFSDLAYALEAAQQHQRAERRHYDADYEVRSVDVDGGVAVDGAGDRGNYGVDLGHVAYTEGRKHSEQ